MSEDTATTLEPILDQLVTLRALKLLSMEQRSELNGHLTENAEGMDKLITTMASLVAIERAKTSTPINQWKGYVAESIDPRRQVRLATREQGVELLKTGWTKVKDYVGDSNDTTQGLAYYVSSVGDEVTYNQGALQMVVKTAGGMMQGTGQSLSVVTGLTVQGDGVGRITNAKKRGLGNSTTGNMIPIFGTDSETGLVS